MKAVVLKDYGGVEQLVCQDIGTPKPGEGEVLVKVAAIGVNPIDWKLRSGAMRQFMPLELPAVLGHDLAGEVSALGPGVSGFKIGQRVMALASRAYAEYAVVKADVLAHIPDGLNFEQAAAIPLVTLTGAQLIERGTKPKGGQSVLITGALGGVGRTAAYVAGQHHVQVIAAVRTAQLEETESLGTLALVSVDDDEALSIFKDIDAVADTVGGPVAVKMLKHLRHRGTFASVVGVPAEAKDYDIRVEQVVAQPDAARLAQLAEDVAAGRLKIPIAKVMRLSEAGEAHRLGQGGGVGGKIILIP